MLARACERAWEHLAAREMAPHIGLCDGTGTVLRSKVFVALIGSTQLRRGQAQDTSRAPALDNPPGHVHDQQRAHRYP
jgi:hypothetical protein